MFAALAVVIIILLITYRSPVLWLLPVIAAGVSLATAQGIIYLLAEHGLTVNAQSAGTWTCSYSARARTTPFCSPPATARSCGDMKTGMPRWRSRFAGPGPRSWRAAAR